MVSRRHFWAPLIGALCVASLPAYGRPFPSELIRIIVPAPPGGGADVLVRSMTNELQGIWGQSVTVENRGGGSGGIGARAVVAAPADGHTLLVGSTNTIMSFVQNTEKPYDVKADMAPVTLVAAPPYLVVAHPSVPVKSAAELIAYAKRNPGKLSYGSSGEGSASHLSGALFAQVAGVDMLHVPYRGMGAVLTDLLGGRVPLAFAPAPAMLPHIKSGRLRVIGTTGPKRSGLFPDYPTIAESGLPQYSSVGSFGVFAPPTTPADVVARISADVGKVLRLAEVKKRFADQGAEPAASTPEEFTVHVNALVAQWIDLVRKTGIKIIK